MSTGYSNRRNVERHSEQSRSSNNKSSSSFGMMKSKKFGSSSTPYEILNHGPTSLGVTSNYNRSVKSSSTLGGSNTQSRQDQRDKSSHRSGSKEDDIDTMLQRAPLMLYNSVVEPSGWEVFNLDSKIRLQLLLNLTLPMSYLTMAAWWEMRLPMMPLTEDYKELMKEYKLNSLGFIQGARFFNPVAGRPFTLDRLLIIEGTKPMLVLNFKVSQDLGILVNFLNGCLGKATKEPPLNAIAALDPAYSTVLVEIEEQEIEERRNQADLDSETGSPENPSTMQQNIQQQNLLHQHAMIQQLMQPTSLGQSAMREQTLASLAQQQEVLKEQLLVAAKQQAFANAQQALANRQNTGGQFPSATGSQFPFFNQPPPSGMPMPSLQNNLGNQLGWTPPAMNMQTMGRLQKNTGNNRGRSNLRPINMISDTEAAPNSKKGTNKDENKNNEAAKLNLLTREQLLKQRRCFYCKKQGHEINACPVKPGVKRPGQAGIPKK